MVLLFTVQQRYNILLYNESPDEKNKSCGTSFIPPSMYNESYFPHRTRNMFVISAILDRTVVKCTPIPLLMLLMVKHAPRMEINIKWGIVCEQSLFLSDSSCLTFARPIPARSRSALDFRYLALRYLSLSERKRDCSQSNGSTENFPRNYVQDCRLHCPLAFARNDFT